MLSVNRKELRDLVKRWVQGELDERDVHETAEALCETWEDWPDYEEDDPRSIAIEVLSQLELLNQQLVTTEDVPMILQFLNTPPGKEQAAWLSWKAYWDELDFEVRQRSLQAKPYYSQLKLPPKTT